MEILSSEEVAERLGLAVRTVQRLCANGEFPGARQVGRGGWVIPAAALEGYQPRKVGNPNWVRKGEQE